MAAGAGVVAAETDGGAMPMAAGGDNADRGRPMQAYERLWRLDDAILVRELAIREAILGMAQ